jgi:hypothetical protein
MANHPLVLLDSPGVVDEDYICAGHGMSFEQWVPLCDGAIEFVKGLAAGLYVPLLHVVIFASPSNAVVTIEEQLGLVILFSHSSLEQCCLLPCFFVLIGFSFISPMCLVKKDMIFYFLKVIYISNNFML